MRKSTLRFLGISVFYIVYLVVGALIFSAIEGPKERELRDDLKRIRANFMNDNLCLTDENLEKFIVAVIEANQRGVSASNNVSIEPNWSFGQAVFFAGTVLTTIGYGHVTPLSEGGKMFCIIYAAFGIPLTLILFTAIVERLMIATSKLQAKLQAALSQKWKTLSIRLLHLSIILSLLLVLVFFVPAAIFTVLEEEWNYLDSFYYCFISMTTIGLGDYIPGDQEGQVYRPVYKIFTTFYLFFGLILMMLSLATIYEIPEMNLGSHFYLQSDEDDTSEKQSLRPSDNSVRYTEQVNEAFDKSGGEAVTSQ